MRTLNFLLVTLFAVLLSLTFSAVIDANSGINDDSSCNCDYCNVTDVVSLEHDEDTNKTSQENNIWDKEDFDGDGDLTICARDRDHKDDRSFSSICHMHCHNKCTQYGIKTLHIENKMKKYIASISRTNYYKLRDGPC